MAEIVVGVSAPLSGRLAAQGKEIEKGVADAVEEINATRGGLLGEKLRVVAIDDGCDAKMGVEAARKLVAEKAAVVIGHPCASAALAAAPVYAQAGTLLFGLTRHPDFTDKRAGPTIFRMAGRDDRQGEAIAAHVLKTLPGKRIAFVQDRTQYARFVTQAVQRKLGAAGVVPVLVEGIVAGERDYAKVATRLEQVAAEVVVFAGYPSEARVVLQSMKAKGVKAAFVASDAVGSDATFDGLDGTTVFKAASAAQLMGSGGATLDLQQLLARLAVKVWQWAMETRGAGSEPPVAQLVQTAVLPLPELVGQSGRAKEPVRTLGFDATGDPALPSFQIFKVVAGQLSPAD